MTTDFGTSPMNATPTAERQRAKDLAKQVVLAQGNVFIKELLREKGRIGTNKDDFARNLEAAIDDGTLGLDDIRTWVQGVEGWGTQHVYLYDVPRAFAQQNTWRSPDRIERAIRAAGLGQRWAAPITHGFSDKMSLTRIVCEGGAIIFEWHEGGALWIRDQQRDIPPRPEDDGEIYKYQAFRQRNERAVMRFVFRPTTAFAAAFIPLPVTSEAHRTARAQMMAVVHEVIPSDQLMAFNVGRAIGRLDEAQLRDGATFSTDTTRLSGGGAYVEFGSTVAGHGYREVDTIREVRLAVRVDQVTGTTATITFSAPGQDGPARDIRVQFYGNDGRLWLRAQMTSRQVWVLLDEIRKIGRSRGTRRRG